METSYPEANQIAELINGAQDILIVQADNPDGDSVASALALEEILGDMGKTPHLYCGVDIPVHLHYLSGWSRVSKTLPPKFDMSIIVDTSSDTLLELLEISGQKMWLKNKPCVILDHHPVPNSIMFATVVCNHPAVACGELIYELGKQLGWRMNNQCENYLATAILSDSLGLMSEGTTPRSIHIIAELVENGVVLAELEAARRETMRRSPELVDYKGRLLQRVEYYADNRVAVISIPWDEIEAYSQSYNPSMLVLDDMRLTEGTEVAIAFKIYPDGKITGKIRCNFGSDIANQLAESFGGGGHAYASGFKIQDATPYDELKARVIARAAELLDQKKEAKLHETV